MRKLTICIDNASPLRGLALYRLIHRNCPQRRTPSQNGGSASRIHQHTAQKRGVRLQNPSTKGGSASRIHQPKGGSASRFHQPEGGPPLDFINQKGVRLQNSSTYSPKKGVRLQNSSTYSPKMGVRLQNSSTINLKMGVRLQGQFLWIQRYRLDGRKGAFFLGQGPVQGPREGCKGHVQGPPIR